jgi:hypothetical protein
MQNDQNTPVIENELIPCMPLFHGMLGKHICFLYDAAFFYVLLGH